MAPWKRWLAGHEHMQVGMYRFRVVWKRDALLPEYKGSTLRGAFGHALRGIVCAFRHRGCRECPLNTRCLYAQAFEENTWGRPAGLRQSAAPHPILFLSPEDKKRFYPRASEMTFGLKVFGDFNRELAFFVLAVQRMGKGGLGKGIESHRGTFSIVSVCHEGMELWDIDHERLEIPRDVPELALSFPPEEISGEARVRIRFVTPMRTKVGKTLPDSLPFKALITHIVRRVHAVFETYGEGEPDLDYPGLLKRAEDVRICESDLWWQDWERWSNRQKKMMCLGGLMGGVVYQGALAPFTPLLELGKELHVGKNTMFGLGKMEMEWIDEATEYGCNPS